MASGPAVFFRPTVSSRRSGVSATGSNMSGRAASGALDWLSMMTCSPAGVRMWKMPPPEKPTIIGSTTVSVNSVATAASTALPPAASISAPAIAPSGLFAVTMPRLPVAGCFSQSKVTFARARHDGSAAGD